MAHTNTAFVPNGYFDERAQSMKQENQQPRSPSKSEQTKFIFQANIGNILYAKLKVGESPKFHRSHGKNN